MSRRACSSLVVSIAIHGALIGAAAWGAVVEANGSVMHAKASIDPQGVRRAAAVMEAREQRARLVEAARAQRASGGLEVGRFLIEAARIDALERGTALDAELAGARYSERLAQLRQALAVRPIEQAAAEVFGDLRYYGRPGGNVAELLLSGGGSCEQLSLLIAAVSHDSGRGEVALRFYGAPGPHGVAHVAPVVAIGAIEHDLVAGARAHRGGVRVQVEEIVEVYARARGLAPRIEGGAGGQAADEQELAQPSLIAGFPPNHDAYPGSLPLYAAHAVRGPAHDSHDAQERQDAGEQDPLQDVRRCGYSVRMAVLEPLVVQAWASGSAGAIDLEPRRVPHASRLETESALLGDAWHVATAAGSRPGDRLMAWACVAALGELTSIDFALALEPELARKAAAQAKAARERGGEMARGWGRMTKVQTESVRADLAEHAGRTWLLLVLDGGEGIVIDQIDHAQARGWGKISSLAGLLVFRPTRERALAMIERYPLDDQVDVMHEMYHVHDHMAPWGSDFDMDAGQAQRSSGFVRAWKVFRGLAWRLWNGRRGVGEMIEALQQETSRAGLGQAWEAAFLEYTSRNVLGLLAMRSPELEPVRQLKIAAQRNGHSTMVSLVRRLEFIEGQGELSAPTLADAWQMK